MCNIQSLQKLSDLYGAFWSLNAVIWEIAASKYFKYSPLEFHKQQQHIRLSK